MSDAAERNRQEQRAREINVGNTRHVTLSGVEDRPGQNTALTWDGGGVGVPLPDDHGLRKGDDVRLYTEGAGSRVRGVDVWDGDDWEPVLFLTDAEIRARDRDHLWESAEQKALDFAENYDELQKRIASLPARFRRRIRRFRRNRPRFLIEYGEYEVMACEEAVAMATWAREQTDGMEEQPADALERLSDATHKETQEMYDRRHGGHSGNSWHFAIRLAHHAVTNPELVELEHGAMSPLTGCEDYGCPPPSEEEWREETPAALT